jgi:hypothetical protein
MNEGLIFHWPMLLFFLAALFYFELIHLLDKYWANRTPLSDEERLWRFARSRGISEHEVFKWAAATWSLNPDKADKDFNTYLKSDTLPHYVRDYLRKR